MLSEDSLKDNFIFVLQVLHETMEGGYPRTLQATIIKVNDFFSFCFGL